MIGTILSSLGLAVETINRIVKLVQPKLSVTPRKIKLDLRDWGVESYFTICNKTEKPLYDIQVLLWHNVKEDSKSTFPMVIKSLENQDKDPETFIGPIIANTNILIIDGEIKGKKVKLLQLGYLNSKECRRVFYSFDSQIKGEIYFQAYNISTEPPQTPKKPNSFGISFKAPKEIKVLKGSFFMKRKL
jgi:hypothetical protein